MLRELTSVPENKRHPYFLQVVLITKAMHEKRKGNNMFRGILFASVIHFGATLFQGKEVCAFSLLGRQSIRVPTRLQLSDDFNSNGRERGDIISHESFEHDYVLHQSECMSSGSAEIQEAYRRCDQTGHPVGDKVMIKFSSNNEAMEREVENTHMVSECHNEDVIINILDHNMHSDASPKDGDAPAMIVMEKGCQDLLSYVNENEDMNGDKLREAVLSIVRSIASIHANGMVWSDAKLSNFVVQENANTVKAIDLESCARLGSQPPKFTPSTCPPEFVDVIQACLDGRPEEGKHEVDFAFDIWSLGSIVFVLATGESFHPENMDIVAITNTLATVQQSSIDSDPRLSQVPPLKRDFILRCLRVNPLERPSIEELLNHPFLVTPNPDSVFHTSDSYNCYGPTTEPRAAFAYQTAGEGMNYDDNHLAAYEKQFNDFKWQQ